ncbi:MAG: histidinol-phosphatase [Eisenbergiella sp.]
MKKVNYHTHTKLCMHATGTEKDYVQAALDAGLDILGFSDHAPFPDNRFDSRMRYDQLDEHLSHICSLRDALQKGEPAGAASGLTGIRPLRILAGLEIEYCMDMSSYYPLLLSEKKLDYLLLGHHYYMEDDGSYVHVFSIPKKYGTPAYLKYAYEVRSALETGFFPILAHPDVIFTNNFVWDKNCSEACDLIVDAAARTGTVLELNANGIRKGIRLLGGIKRFPYPHPEFWKRVSAAKLPVVIGSDCHSPSYMWDECVSEAFRLAKEWKLELVDSF